MHPAEVTGKHKAARGTLLTCTGVRNQTHNDRHRLTYWDIPEVPLYSTYPGQLGRSRVLRRLSSRICPSSAGKSFGIVSRAQGWYKFGMCTGRGGVRVIIEHGLYRRTQKYTEPAITRARYHWPTSVCRSPDHLGRSQEVPGSRTSGRYKL